MPPIQNVIKTEDRFVPRKFKDFVTMYHNENMEQLLAVANDILYYMNIKADTVIAHQRVTIPGTNEKTLKPIDARTAIKDDVQKLEKGIGVLKSLRELLRKGTKNSETDTDSAGIEALEIVLKEGKAHVK